MSRGKPSKGPRHTLSIRVDEALWAEVILLRPQIQGADGSTRYGAVNDYVVSLIRQDVNEIKRRLRQASQGALPNG